MARDTSKRMPVKVRCQWALGHGGELGRSWCLRFIDEESGVIILDVEMTPEEFGLAVGCMSITVDRGEIGALDTMHELVGKRRETKQESVFIGGAWGEDGLMLVRENAREFEVDGWKAEHDRRFNLHRVTGGEDDRRYRVTFARWVDYDADQQEGSDG